MTQKTTIRTTVVQNKKQVSDKNYPVGVLGREYVTSLRLVQIAI